MSGTGIYGYLGIGFVFGILVLIVILLVVLMKQVYKTKHIQIASEAELSRDTAYRKLAESSCQLQREIKEGQDKLAAELVQLRTRVAAIEKLLREVE